MYICCFFNSIEVENMHVTFLSLGASRLRVRFSVCCECLVVFSSYTAGHLATYCLEDISLLRFNIFEGYLGSVHFFKND